MKDRKYFVPKQVVSQIEELPLASSRILKLETDRTPESYSLKKVAGDPKVTEKEFEAASSRGTARRTEGRQARTFAVTRVDTLRETTTTTLTRSSTKPWEERSRKTLRNVYRVKINLTLPCEEAHVGSGVAVTQERLIAFRHESQKR